MRLAFWSQNIFKESPTSPPARLGVCAKHALHLSCLLRLPARDGLRTFSKRVPEGSRGFFVLWGIFVEGRGGLNSLSERPEDNTETLAVSGDLGVSPFGSN